MNCMPTLDPRIFTDAPPETFESMYREGYADVSGVRLHYTDWNPSGERTIVLVHGLNVQLHTWDPIAAALSAELEFGAEIPHLFTHDRHLRNAEKLRRRFVS